MTNKYTDADLRAFAEGALQPASQSAAWVAAARHLIAWSPANVLEMLDRVERLEAELNTTRRFLYAEKELSDRLGANNQHWMQRLGVQYPNGIDSGIDRLTAERDAAIRERDELIQRCAFADHEHDKRSKP